MGQVSLEPETTATWRIHVSFDPAKACFTDLQLTGAEGSDLAIGDRFYAKPPGLQHVLRLGADFLVRVGWNSVRMVTANGARLDLTSIYARMGPGETSEVRYSSPAATKARVANRGGYSRRG